VNPSFNPMTICLLLKVELNFFAAYLFSSRNDRLPKRS